jgi:hypothetical protein
MIKDFLLQKKQEGLDAYQAVRALLEKLKVPMAPTRFEVSSSPSGWARLVAVLEKDGQEVDRVSLKKAPFTLEGEVLEGLPKAVERLNALPLEERPLVGFYPYGEEETLSILQAIEEVAWTDREDYLGHPFRSVIGVAWKDWPSGEPPEKKGG